MAMNTTLRRGPTACGNINNSVHFISVMIKEMYSDKRLVTIWWRIIDFWDKEISLLMKSNIKITSCFYVWQYKINILNKLWPHCYYVQPGGKFNAKGYLLHLIQFLPKAIRNLLPYLYLENVKNIFQMYPV